jgi:hypothetical protein
VKKTRFSNHRLKQKTLGVKKRKVGNKMDLVFTWDFCNKRKTGFLASEKKSLILIIPTGSYEIKGYFHS